MAAKKKPLRDARGRFIKAPLSKRKPARRNVKKEKANTKLRVVKIKPKAKPKRKVIKNSRGKYVDAIRSKAAKAQWVPWSTPGGKVTPPRSGKMRKSEMANEKRIYDIMMQAEKHGVLDMAMRDLAKATGIRIGELYTDYYHSPKAAEYMG